ncbi:MAG: exosome complex RNA-binding protein Csl4 [Thermoplasmata archaeon]
MTPPDLPLFVVPGDYLGAAEEFVPGAGTYETSGRIFASVAGRPTVDERDRTVRVEAANAVPTLAEGQAVFARIDEMKTAMAICTIVADARTGRGIPGAPEGTIHISKAKEGYTESLADEFSVGDVVLAKVLQASPSVKLTTASPSLGVISARCHACRGLLVPTGRGLECLRCGNRERRKLATGSDHLTPFLPPS